MMVDVSYLCVNMFAANWRVISSINVRHQVPLTSILVIRYM